MVDVKIEACLLAGHEVPLDLWFKAGSDNFSWEMFNSKSIPNEQYGIVLLIPGMDANSYLNYIPTSFAFNQSESYQLQKTMNLHLKRNMPASVTVRGQVYTLTQQRMGDRHNYDFDNGHQGPNATHPCIHCEDRFGEHGPCISLQRGLNNPQVKRTTEGWDFTAALAHPFHELQQWVKTLPEGEKTL